MSWNTITDFHISLTASDIDRASITAFLTENLEGPKAATKDFSFVRWPFHFTIDWLNPASHTAFPDT